MKRKHILIAGLAAAAAACSALYFTNVPADLGSTFSTETAAASVSSGPLATRTGFFFDTVITVSLYDTDDETILDHCFEKMAYYESILSRTKEGSDITRVNEADGETVEVSEDTAWLISRGLEYGDLSDGAFDIGIAPVVDLWDFHQDHNPTVPDADKIAEAVKHVDYKQIAVDGLSVTLSDPEGGIDLGAIAKGFISDKIRDVIVEDGCKSAMINLGGNVMTVGTKPNGSKWNIGIRKPFADTAADLIAIVPVESMSVITSGTYERYFTEGDKLYHHILSPEDGYPVDNGLTSVSILSKNGTDGDALSTTCFVLGPEKGMELIESLDGIEALFVDSDNNLTYSSGWPE